MQNRKFWKNHENIKMHVYIHFQNVSNMQNK